MSLQLTKVKTAKKTQNQAKMEQKVKERTKFYRVWNFFLQFWCGVLMRIVTRINEHFLFITKV